jgi:chromosome segregation ATPase
MSNSMFTQLEPRQLLSHGHSTPTAPDASLLEAAKQAVMVDYQSLVSHVEANRTALDAARQLLKEHGAATSTQLSDLRSEVSGLEKSMKNAIKAARVQRDALRTQWETVIDADQLDVDTFTEGETEQEQQADMVKLETDKSAANTALSAATDEARASRTAMESSLDDKRDGINALSKDLKRSKKSDEQAVKSAERTLKSVFQSDRKILDSEIKRYKKQGFKTDALELPALPKV